MLTIQNEWFVQKRYRSNYCLNGRKLSRLHFRWISVIVKQILCVECHFHIWAYFLCHGKYCAVNRNGSMPLTLTITIFFFLLFPQTNIQHPFNSTGISTPLILPFFLFLMLLIQFFISYCQYSPNGVCCCFTSFGCLIQSLCYIAYTVGIVSLSRAHVILQFS